VSLQVLTEAFCQLGGGTGTGEAWKLNDAKCSPELQKAGLTVLKQLAREARRL